MIDGEAEHARGKLVDDIHDALDALRADGVKAFDVEELQRRIVALADMPPRQVDRMLLEMRRGGEHIHQDGLAGPDGTNVWRFGYRPVRTPERKLPAQWPRKAP
jgi:hypothetical protein